MFGNSRADMEEKERKNRIKVLVGILVMLFCGMAVSSCLNSFRSEKLSILLGGETSIVEVTNESGEVVTNKKGEALTELWEKETTFEETKIVEVTDENHKAVTGEDGKAITQRWEINPNNEVSKLKTDIKIGSLLTSLFTLLFFTELWFLIKALMKDRL